MKIKFKDEESFKEDLKRIKSWAEKTLQKDLSEKEFTEENYKEFQSISMELLKLRWIKFEGAKIKLLSSDGTELNNIF